MSKRFHTKKKMFYLFRVSYIDFTDTPPHMCILIYLVKKKLRPYYPQTSRTYLSNYEKNNSSGTDTVNSYLLNDCKLYNYIDLKIFPKSYIYIYIFFSLLYRKIVCTNNIM